MDNYITLKDNQVAGEIKRKPDDFVVKEIICENIVCDEIQKYSDSDENEAMIFLMKLNNWDQFKAISYIASITGINKSCISFSGTKDKFAVTSQLISVDISSGVSYKDVENLGVKDIELTYLGKGSRLHIGKLWGNRFQIRVYFDKADLKNVRRILSSVDGNVYFPNYFGPQRFGTKRPISHVVGKHLIHSDLEGAVMSYICDSVVEEDQDIQEARKLASEGDYNAAFDKFPDVMHYEKIMLSVLVKKNSDFEGAFKIFPLSMRKMFVHAYQSYLFNKVLSEIILLGDDDNLDIEIPLFGYGLKIIKIAKLREAMQKVLREEDVDLSAFRVSFMPFLSSKGGIRKGFEKAHNFKVVFIEGENCVDLSFDLKKGCYATVFLREFFKI